MIPHLVHLFVARHWPRYARTGAGPVCLRCYRCWWCDSSRRGGCCSIIRRAS